MSRAATVTLTFVGDTSQLDQVYEAFVRKASRPIAVPLTGGTSGATASVTSASTTFANASVPGAVPAPPAGGGGLGDTSYQQAVNRLTAAITQQAQLVEQATSSARTSRAGSGERAYNARYRAVVGLDIAKAGGDPFREAGIYAEAASAFEDGSVESIRYLTQSARAARRGYAGQRREAARVDREQTRLDRTFDSAIDSLARQEERAGNRSARLHRRYAQQLQDEAEDEGEGGGGGPMLGRIGRQLLYSAAGYAGAHALRAYSQMGMGERLAYGPNGQVDLRRQYAAQTRFADQISNFPIAGPVADYLVEGVTGLREGAAATLQDADYLDRQTALRGSGADYRRRIGNRAAILGGQGDYERAQRRAIVDRNEAYQDALARRNEMGAAGDANGGNKLFAEASEWIEKEFSLTMQDLTRQYSVGFNRLRADIPAIAARAQGRTRAAGRMEIEADVAAEVGGEMDPGRRELLQQRGRARLDAYDETLRRQDVVRGGEVGFMTDAYRAQARGDEAGALRSRQLARRIREMGPPSDDPNRAAVGRMLDQQDAAEEREFTLQRAYRTAGLEGMVQATGLAATGQNTAAQAQAIFSRGTLASRQDSDAGRLGDAVMQLTVASNELAALRLNYEKQGAAAEFGAGSLAAGGTQGNFPIEDMSKALQSIDNMTAELSRLTTAINSMVQDN